MQRNLDRAMSFMELLLVLLLVVLVAACGPVSPTPVLTPTRVVVLPTDTLAPGATDTDALPATEISKPAATDTPIPSTMPTASPAVPELADLKATVVAGLPATPTAEPSGGIPWGDVEILPLEAAEGRSPLWAAYTVGMGFYDLEHGHLVAIYTVEDGDWRELSRVTLADCAEFVNADSLAQVQVEPDRTWLEMQSTTGAHSGCFDLMSFDGETLRVEASNWSSSPGAGDLADLDGDGLLEAILDHTEYYIFCYACGVTLPSFSVLRWDGERMAEVEPQFLPESAPDDLRRLNNRALELGGAGLWKEAETAIADAQASDVGNPDLESTVAWNAILLNLTAQARAEEAQRSPYPLLGHLFYGDHVGALEVMRPYSVEEIWSLDTPLVAGTVAEGWELELSDWISWTTNLALEVEPELAPAYFLRGWATYLRQPGEPSVLADVERAAGLEPGEPLFSDSFAYLQEPVLPEPSPVAPEATATPLPTQPPSPTATTIAWQDRWEVHTLLVGPGEPDRLYAFFTEEWILGDPAERPRLLISDDYGQTWSPFPGGLPLESCVRNVNLDYATPDALWASTCQGLYRWSGSEWVFVSPRETGMVAIVYGQPNLIWATNPFGSGGALSRSEDGGQTWEAAGRGLIHFNGVANVGVDPRDANTLYAIIWPKYAGSYLRRGSANDQWTTMPTPLDNGQIETGMTIDGQTRALYVIAWASREDHYQLWKTLNPTAPDVNDVQWEMVHDFGGDVMVELLASGWSPEGLAIYVSVNPVTKLSGAGIEIHPQEVHRSLDGGRTWAPLSIPWPESEE